MLLMKVITLIEQGDTLREVGAKNAERDVKIALLYSQGLSYRKIGAQLNLSHTQVMNIINRLRKNP